MLWIQDQGSATAAAAVPAPPPPLHLEVPDLDRARRCRLPDCRVGGDGRADCGALACPACGLSGWNLVCPDGFDGDWLVRCTCGFSWVRPEAA